MFFDQKDRRVLPRWRDFNTTLALGELSRAKPREPVSQNDREAVTRRFQEWQENPTIWHAADLLSSGFVVGDTDALAEVTEFILGKQDQAPRSLVRLAETIADPSQTSTPDIAVALSEEQISASIHVIRSRLREEPRNAIQWVELARFYVLIGDSERAVKAMRVAVALGPDHRFIVRSAARLFMHTHESSRALRVIRDSAGAKTDPWLSAAEIAVASATGSPSMFARKGMVLNEDAGLSLFERNELSSALATLEMENGKNRRARQLFRKALQCPNENSVAQVEWANRQIGGLEIEKEAFTEVPLASEATAQVNLVNGEWKSAIVQGVNWLNDQPFSKRPAIFTSYVSSLIEEYERSITILKASLKANPGDPLLLNNLAFALASNNQLEDALDVLRGTNYADVSGPGGITLQATTGLMFFRSGNPDKGRELYRLAIERATQLGITKYKLMATLYLAREELLAATPGALITARNALENVAAAEEKDIRLVADQVYRLARKMSAVNPQVQHG